MILYTNSGQDFKYQWQLNGKNIKGATSVSLLAEVAGIYTVFIEKDECFNISEPLNVPAEAIPTASINPSKPDTLCEGDTLLLTASSGAEYTWYHNGVLLQGEHKSVLKVYRKGTYHVEVGGVNHCTKMSHPVEVTLRPKPFAYISEEFYFLNSQTSMVMLSTGKADSYQWFLNGRALPNQTSPSLQTISPGEYSVEVRLGKCKAKSEPVSVIFDHPLGIEASHHTNISIRSNPFTEQALIVFENHDLPQKITISDLNGNILYAEQDSSVKNNLSWGKEVPVGLYMLHLIYADKSIVYKLQKF